MYDGHIVHSVREKKKRMRVVLPCPGLPIQGSCMGGVYLHKNEFNKDQQMNATSFLIAINLNFKTAYDHISYEIESNNIGLEVKRRTLVT